MSIMEKIKMNYLLCFNDETWEQVATEEDINKVIESHQWDWWHSGTLDDRNVMIIPLREIGCMEVRKNLPCNSHKQ